MRPGTDFVLAIGGRVRQERKAQALTLKEASGRIGISHAYLSDIEHGKVAPTWRVLDGVCTWRGQSLEWLLFGEEEAAERVDDESCVHELAGHYTTDRQVRLPLVGRVSANPHPEVIWEPIDPPEYREVPKGAVALEVRGDSMQPVAYEGQAVIAVDLPVENGDLVAVEMKDGRQFFKRWWWREGRKLAILESVRREAIEPPVPIKLRDCRHVWRVVGVLF